MNKEAELRKLACELDMEHCADFPVKWIADKLREIADGDTR